MRLIRGAPGSGKTALVFREFSEAVHAGRNSGLLRIIVPTATLVRHYQHELARSGLVFDPGTIMSLSRFAQERANVNSRGPALAPGGLVRALVRASLGRLSVPEFQDVAATPGMADILVEAMALFENADCTPERLSHRNLSPYGKAFLRVWKDVDAAVAARGFATRAQIFRTAAACTSPATLWLDGFLNFSPLERGLVRTLSANCDLTMTLSDGPMGFGSDLQRFAMELGASDRLLTGRPRRPRTIAVEAASPGREADEIARRIVELHSDGIEYEGIAVALRDVDNWLPLLRSTFDRFGIPARYYFPTKFTKHPAAVFLHGLVSNALNGWDFEKTVHALRANPGWGRSAEFDRFDFRVREAMPGTGADALLSLCDSDWLRAHIADCLSVEKWRGESALPEVWRQRLAQMAERLYRLPEAVPPEDYSAVETGRSHAVGIRSWTAAISAAASFFSEADGPVSFRRFADALGESLTHAEMRIPDDRRSVVHVMSAFEARQWEVRALFVCGVTARDYPRRHAQNLLFPDDSIQQLCRAGIPLRTAADEERDEELLFGSLKTRASDVLILTASATDSGGRSIVPSPHFQAVAIREKARACRPAARYLAAEVGPPGVISEASRAGLEERHRTISLTGLEDLTKCRFRFYAGKTLELKDVPDRPSERLQARVTGLIFHQAMEVWLSDKTRDFVELFETTFDDECRKRHIPPGYKVEVERIRFRRIARQVNASAQWPAASSEAEVDCAFDFPGGVTVKCRVDRIDHLGGGDCVIVDYKSGKVQNVDKLLESETSLQGPLYALAVREKKGLNPVAMVFLAIREGKPVGWGAIPGSGLELAPMPPDWIDAARERTEARLAGFLAGDVHAEPASRDDCVWCDFKNACRIEQREAERPDTVTIGAAGGN